MEIQSFTTDRGSPTLAMSIAGSNLSATHMAIRTFSARLGGELVFHKAEVPGCDVLHLLFGQSLPDAQLSSLQGCVASILDVYFYICFDYLLFHLQWYSIDFAQTQPSKNGGIHSNPFLNTPSTRMIYAEIVVMIIKYNQNLSLKWYFHICVHLLAFISGNIC